MKKQFLLTAFAMAPALGLANHDLAIELVEVTAERDLDPLQNADVGN